MNTTIGGSLEQELLHATWHPLDFFYTKVSKKKVVTVAKIERYRLGKHQVAFKIVKGTKNEIAAPFEHVRSHLLHSFKKLALKRK